MKATISSRMPALFVGHGSPMNAIEDNTYTRGWENIASIIPKPKAILAISAHWYTKGTRVADTLEPNTIHDMYGFPDELYHIRYDAPGAPELAHAAQKLASRDVQIDNSWGIDHGAWSVLHKMYPEADIPVFQLSVDRGADARTHFNTGKELSLLREKGVLLFASGNVVHNLARIDWEMKNGYPWAEEFDSYIKVHVINKNYEAVIDFTSAGKSSSMAFTTPEHFFPLLYTLGAAHDDDNIEVFNDSCTMGSLSMTCYLLQ